MGVIAEGKKGYGLLKMMQTLVRLQRTGSKVRTKRDIAARVAALSAEQLEQLLQGAPYKQFRSDQEKCYHIANSNLGALRSFKNEVDKVYGVLLAGLAKHVQTMQELRAAVVHKRYEFAIFVLQRLNMYEVIEAKKYFLMCEDELEQLNFNAKTLATMKMPTARKSARITELKAKLETARGDQAEAEGMLAAAKDKLASFATLVLYEETCAELGKTSIFPQLEQDVTAVDDCQPRIAEYLQWKAEQQALTAGGGV